MLRSPHLVRCVLFDAVGTLIYPHPSVAAVYQAAGVANGCDLPIETIRTRFREALVHYSVSADLRSDETLERQRWRQIVAHVFAESERPDAILERLWNHFAQDDSWSVYEDALPTLEKLGPSYRIGLASNFDQRLRGIAGHWPCLADAMLFVSSEVGWAKPSPLFYGLIAQVLQLQPHQILLVGDDARNDYHGATAAGYQALYLTRDGNVPEDIEAEATIQSLTEVVTRLA
ncbi:HAD-IA family hydrolase [Blastopirellula sp. JC732]|uniref:HAD-IA family hydrolase n=1 Tax=Blastopirellula sediminis TaxID=2894196 RepID=A0A9X1MML3_9BACT|nr:HAD-IA family hydrolase [Blastopirellula sediminis]MCC9607283.1 HAD-IA family hydrolase [Blastopirellula sediminis]MCC9629424.1 HAD-IA family hydrolase [Blastopirellula sediminis]